MGDEQKEIVRIESFWIDTWLRANYKGVETRYVIHDAVAREVLRLEIELVDFDAGDAAHRWGSGRVRLENQGFKRGRSSHRTHGVR
jgi:hypothetical protein